MSKLWTWYKRRHWAIKVALAVPVVALIVVLFVAGGRKPSRKITDAAVDAIDGTAEAGAAAIKTIEEENHAIQDRATDRTDAVVDAASEPCGQFDSAADFYSDSRDRRQD